MEFKITTEEALGPATASTRAVIDGVAKEESGIGIHVMAKDGGAGASAGANASVTASAGAGAGAGAGVSAMAVNVAGLGAQPKASSGGGDPRLAVLVSPRQESNSLLSYIRNVPYRFERDIAADYISGTTAIMFVTVKFHMQKAGYVEKRLASVPRGGSFKLRVLLVIRDVDPDTCEDAILFLMRLCIKAEWTMLLASSDAEAARMIEAFKIFEHKPASAIQERIQDTFIARAQDALCTVDVVTRPDTVKLLDQFGTLTALLGASERDMTAVMSIGTKKSRALFEAFNKPFLVAANSEHTIQGRAFTD